MSYEAIPAELRERAQWVMWRAEKRKGKLTKVPYRADGCGGASSTNPATWASFDVAVAGAEEHAADGIGFVFSIEDPYCGVDLDVFDANAAAIVDRLGSYTETSVSGRGAHVIVRAALNGHPRNRTGPLEIYETGRFFVMTGAHIVGTPGTIEPRQAELEEVLAEHLPPKTSIAVEVLNTGTRAPHIPVDLDDQKLLELAMSARNGAEFRRLWQGDTSGHGDDHSTADMALVGRLRFWSRANARQIDRLFRASGLMRDKWDEPRGASTYGAMTIEKVIAEGGAVYEGPRSRNVLPGREGGKSPAGGTALPRGGASWPKLDVTTSTGRLTATPFTEIAMRSIEWFERPIWQTSAFQLLAGPKGAGKGTYLAGLTSRVSNRGLNVLFISTEDSAEIDLKPRLVAAGADMARVHLIREHVDLPGDVEEIRALALSIGGVGALVIDPVANHIGDTNSNSDAEVRHAIAPLNALADDLACLLIGVRHPGKDRSRGAVASILGSTAWVDTPRAVVFIAADDEDEDLRHVQVVAGNRSRNGSAQAFRIEAVDLAGLAEPITVAVELGESGKSVERLLEIRNVPATKTGKARELILDILENEGEQESDVLDERVALELGLSPRTVRDERMKLSTEGLVKPAPEKDETGAVTRWLVYRTGARRP